MVCSLFIGLFANGQQKIKRGLKFSNNKTTGKDLPVVFLLLRKGNGSVSSLHIRIGVDGVLDMDCIKKPIRLLSFFLVTSADIAFIDHKLLVFVKQPDALRRKTFVIRFIKPKTENVPRERA